MSLKKSLVCAPLSTLQMKHREEPLDTDTKSAKTSLNYFDVLHACIFDTFLIFFDMLLSTSTNPRNCFQCQPLMYSVWSIFALRSSKENFSLHAECITACFIFHVLWPWWLDGLAVLPPRTCIPDCKMKLWDWFAHLSWQHGYHCELDMIFLISPHPTVSLKLLQSFLALVLSNSSQILTAIFAFVAFLFYFFVWPFFLPSFALALPLASLFGVFFIANLTLRFV